MKFQWNTHRSPTSVILNYSGIRKSSLFCDYFIEYFKLQCDKRSTCTNGISYYIQCTLHCIRLNSVIIFQFISVYSQCTKI